MGANDDYEFMRKRIWPMYRSLGHKHHALDVEVKARESCWLSRGYKFFTPTWKLKRSMRKLKGGMDWLSDANHQWLSIIGASVYTRVIYTSATIQSLLVQASKRSWLSLQLIVLLQHFIQLRVEHIHFQFTQMMG